MIWFRRNAKERKEAKEESERRLSDGAELGKRTTAVADSIRQHIRENDFAAMIDEALHGKAR